MSWLNRWKIGDGSKGVRMDKPDKVNICGVEHTIEYCDNAAEVDIFKRDTMWGQIDYWTRTIRVYDNGQPIEDIWETIIHEVIHGIEHALKLHCFEDSNREQTDDMMRFSVGLADTLIRNGWLK